MGYPILDLLLAHSNRFQASPACPLCGSSLLFIEATFWIYGQDEGCTIPLPVCSGCGLKSSVTKSAPVGREQASAPLADDDEDNLLM